MNQKKQMNGVGRALYGAAIVLLAENKTFISATLFLVSIILILVSIEDNDKEIDYIAVLAQEIRVATVAASIVEFALQNFTAMALLILIAFLSNKVEKILKTHFIK